MPPPQKPQRWVREASRANVSRAASVRSIRSGSTFASRPSASGDAAQAQQGHITLRNGNHADQLNLAQQRAGRREIKLAESVEAVDSLIERPVSDCAERGQHAGTGVVHPEASQIDHDPSDSLVAGQCRDGLADWSRRLLVRNSHTSARAKNLNEAGCPVRSRLSR